MKNNKFIHILTIVVVLLSSLTLSPATTSASVAEATNIIRYAAPDGLTTGECLSWNDACTLQHALEIAVNEDELWVMEGTYYPGSVISDTFQLKDGVSLYGGFPAGGGAWDQRDRNAYPTILSGDIDHDGILDMDNARHVLTSIAATQVTLDGFTITGGYAHGDHQDDIEGGGLYNADSNITLTGITISYNRATYSGGGMINHRGKIVLTDVRFIGNQAKISGGGLWISSISTATLTDVEFNGNLSSFISGGLFNNGSATLMGVIFSGNKADMQGGGMFNQSSGSAELTNVTFSSNLAPGGGGGMVNAGIAILKNVTYSSNSAGYGGGGMWNGGGFSRLIDVTFSSNTAATGGGLLSNWGTIELTNVTFANNSSVGMGGGILTYGTATLTDVTFSGNSALDGGGMSIGESKPTLTNVTFFKNTATRNGGGIYNFGYESSGGSNPILTNVILWENSPDQLFADVFSSATVSYSDIQGGWEGEGNIDADPLLAPLADNGGLTLTHALEKSSPAIDTGSPTTCPPADQRERPRPWDGNLDGIALCDMGAYEFIPMPYQIYFPQAMK